MSLRRRLAESAPLLAADATVAGARHPSRRIWVGGWHEAAVYDRLALPVGAEVRGPADMAVEKVAFSAFCMGRLEWVLARRPVARVMRVANAMAAIGA